MSEDDIPKELRSGTEGPSDGFDEAVEESVKRNIPGVGITSIKPSDKTAYISGDFEQQYYVDVFKPTNGGGREGVVLVSVSKENGEWQANFIQSSL